MTESIFSGIDINNLVYGFFSILIINIFISLFFVNKYLQLKSSNRILAKSFDPKNILSEYFKEQYQKTRDYNKAIKKPKSILDKEVVALRSAYLKIEQNALRDDVDSDLFWLYVNDHLLKLIRIMIPKVFNKETQDSYIDYRIDAMKNRVNSIQSNNSEEVLQRKESIVSSLLRLSDGYKNSKIGKDKVMQGIKRLDDLISLFEDKEKRRDLVAAQVVDRYSKNSNTQIRRLDNETQKSKKSIHIIEQDGDGNSDDFESLIKDLKEKNYSLHNQIALLKKEISDFEKKQTLELGDYEDVSEALIESNEKEIDRLRDIIADQRASLADMENAVRSLESSEEVESLKRYIAESATCIAMLEQELDELRSDTNEMLQRSDDGNIGSTELKELNNKVDEAAVNLNHSEEENSFNELLLEFVSEAVTARSVEDVSLLIYECITNLKFTPSVIITANDKTIELSINNSVPTKDKVLINNMAINETTPGKKGHLIFKLPNISGILRPTYNLENMDKVHECLVRIMRFSDNILYQISQADRTKMMGKNIEECSNDIKKSSFEMDQILDKHSVRTKKLIRNLMQQTQSMARAKGFGASQIEPFRQIEKETLTQYDADDTIRLKLRKQFLTIINKIENDY